jgi:hypothetical protein
MEDVDPGLAVRGPRKVRTKTRARWDRILAVLDEAGGLPLSTNEIAERLPGVVLGFDLYRDLVRLEQDRLILREVMEGSRQAFWKPVMPGRRVAADGGPDR